MRSQQVAQVEGTRRRIGRRSVDEHPGLVVTVAVLLVLEGLYLVVRPQAPDLAAQLARASAVSRGVGLWWAGWYGGINTATYSLVSAHVMNTVGVAFMGLSSTAAVSLFGALLVRNSTRPRAGAAAVSLAACANLFSGRITFAAGMAVVLASFVCLQQGRTRLGLLLTPLAGLISPLAALSQVIGLAALVLTGHPGRRVHLLGVAGSLAPVAVVSLVLGQPSYMPFSADICLYTVLMCAGVLLAPVPRLVRALAVVSAVVAMGAYLIHSPLGANAARMPMLAAAPVVLATASRGTGTRRCTVLTAALVIWPLLNLSSDMAIAAAPSSQAPFYAGLLARLTQQGRWDARVEVLDPASHGAAYYLSTVVPLARGWERQIDAAQNPLFYDGRLTAATYRRWLDQHAVAWVAAPLTSDLDYGSVPEGALVASGLPYLRPVWSNAQWRLYRVVAPAPVADGPLTATALTDNSVDLTATGAGEGTVKVSYSPLLVVRSTDGRLVGRLRPAWAGRELLPRRRPGRRVVRPCQRRVGSHRGLSLTEPRRRLRAQPHGAERQWRPATPYPPTVATLPS